MFDTLYPLRNLCCCLSIIFLIILNFVSFAADDGLSGKAVEKISNSTALLTADTDDGIIYASGYVYAKENDDLFIITRSGIFDKTSAVNVILHGGTENELKATGKFISSFLPFCLSAIKVKMPDYEFEKDTESQPLLSETMPVYISGYPFAQDISPDSEKLAPSFINGAISGLDKDKAGNLLRIKIDASVSYGFIGGGLFDKEGHFLGMVTDTVPSTKIAVAVPAYIVSESFTGFPSNALIENIYKDGDKFKIKFKIRFFDPLDKIKETGIAFFQKADGQNPQILSFTDCKKNQGPLTKAGSYHIYPMKDQASEGFYDLEWLPPNGQASVCIQYYFLYENGEKIYFQPSFVLLDTRRSLPMPAETADKNTIKKETPSAKDPVPVKTGLELKKDQIPCQGFDLIKFNPRFPEFKAFIPDKDWKSFFVVCKNGLISKISYPAFVEQCKIDLAAPTTAAALSKEGLIVAFKDKKELLLFDPESLNIKKHIKVSIPVANLCADADSDVAFASDEYGSTLLVIDLAAGKLKQTLKGIDAQNKIGFNNICLSNNKTVLMTAGYSSIALFNIRKQPVIGYSLSLIKYQETDRQVGEIKILPDNRSFASRNRSAVYDLNNPKNQLYNIQTLNSFLLDAAKNILFTVHTGTLYVYDCKTGEELNKYALSIDKSGSTLSPDFMLQTPGGQLLVPGYLNMYMIKFNAPPEKAEKADGVETDASKPLRVGKSAKRIQTPEKQVIRHDLFDVETFCFEKWTNFLKTLILSDDFKYLYAATEKGVVRKLSSEDFQQEYIIDLGCKLESLSASKSYIVAFTSEKCMAYLLSPEDLSVKGKIPLTFFNIATSKGSDIAYTGTYETLQVVDLSERKIKNDLDSFNIYDQFKNNIERFHLIPGASMINFRKPMLSPDGKMLFTMDASLNKFLTLGHTLKFVQMGPSLNTGFGNAFLSSDARYIIVQPDKTVFTEEIKKYGLSEASAAILTTNEPMKIEGFINVLRSYEDVLYKNGRSCNYVLMSSSLWEFSSRGFLETVRKIPFSRIYESNRDEQIIGVGYDKLGRITLKKAMDFILPVATSRKLPAKMLGDPEKGSQLGERKLLGIKNISDAKWAPDGKSCFVLTKNSLVKLGLPDFQELAIINIKEHLDILAFSKSGILLLSKEMQKVMIFDYETLTLKGEICVGPCTNLLSAQLSDYVIVYNDRDTPYFSVINIREQKVISQKPFPEYIKNPDELKTALGFPRLFSEYDLKNTVLSDNGEYLICRTGKGIYSFRISYDGIPALAYLSRWKSENTDSRLFPASIDSYYVSIFRGKSMTNAASALVIYKIDEFESPVISVDINKLDWVIMDSGSQKILCLNNNKFIIVNPSGAPEKEYNFSPQATRYSWKYFSLSPDGKKLLLCRTNGDLYYAELK